MGDAAGATAPDGGRPGAADDESRLPTDEVEQRGPQGGIHLSQREVEQVIARAVELQQEREVGRDNGLTLDDVQAVVAQVGVEPDLVRRALDEVRLGMTAGDTRAWADRVLGPRRVTATGVVQGGIDDVGRAIATWMNDDEGMLLAGTRDGEDRWAEDKRLLTQVRHGLQVTRSESVLRGLRGVATRTEPASSGTLVAIEADTSSIRVANATVLSISGLAGLGLGIATAAVLPDGAAIASDLAQFAVGLVVPVATGASVTAIVHRTWLGRVRRAVVQALDGISVTSREGGDGRSSSPDWRSVRRRWLGGA